MKTFYKLTRDVHLWRGLFLSPFLIVYAVSTVLVNHSVKPGAAAPDIARGPYDVVVPDEPDKVLLAKDILAQLGMTGEIGGVRIRPAEQRINFPVNVPGVRRQVVVNTETGRAIVLTKRAGVLSGLVYMHFAPGQHLVGVAGNWLGMRLWHWMADATVYVVLLLSATGVYLWTVLKAERKTGLIVLGAGVACFVLLTVGLLF